MTGVKVSLILWGLIVGMGSIGCAGAILGSGRFELGEKEGRFGKIFEFGGEGQRFRGTRSCDITGDMVMIIDSGWSLETDEWSRIKEIGVAIATKKCIDAGTQDFMLLNFGSGLTVASETYDPADAASREMDPDDPMRALGDRFTDSYFNPTSDVTEAINEAITALPQLVNDVNSYMLNLEYPLDEALDKLTDRPTSNKIVIFITDGDFGVNQTTLSELTYSLETLQGFIPIVLLLKDPASKTSSYIDANTSQGSYTTRTTNLPALLIFTGCYSIDDCPQLIQPTTSDTPTAIAETVVALIPS